MGDCLVFVASSWHYFFRYHDRGCVLKSDLVKVLFLKHLVFNARCWFLLKRVLIEFVLCCKSVTVRKNRWIVNKLFDGRNDRSSLARTKVKSLARDVHNSRQFLVVVVARFQSQSQKTMENESEWLCVCVCDDRRCESEVHNDWLLCLGWWGQTWGFIFSNTGLQVYIVQQCQALSWCHQLSSARRGFFILAHTILLHPLALSL